MKFFFDNCLSQNLAEALHALNRPEGIDVVHLRTQFPANVSDVQWITELAKEKTWVVVSGDLRITRNQHEKATWLQSGLTAFFLARGWENLQLWDQAAHLVRKWPIILSTAKNVQSGAGFIVSPKSNKLEQLRLK